MKLGPLDFKQPSTWRGLLILLGLVGWKVSPELREHIAVTLGMAMAAIEMLRDEYRAGRAAGPVADPTADRVRVPPVAPPANTDPNPDPSRLGGDR
ncbi:MAG: hypothetical protein RKO66_00815 [Candidatus Contendobacter sp.]|nr:hypothetical protein [Candidatus Contendobacter sp.]MDS4060303.1 hypothetical protein [Candidatus Contendobacter sp.]